MTSYLSENGAENLQNGDVHLAQIPEFGRNISRTIWRVEVSESSLFCIFHALSFELNFFRPEFPFKLVCIHNKGIIYCTKMRINIQPQKLE